MTLLDARMFFSCLSSQKAAHDFLATCYHRQNIEDADTLAYSNAQAFLHYTTHGLDLYEQGCRLSQSIQPLLYFYGAAHLIKACLLTVCPGYPEQTSQLAHGVSARKRKKRDFLFLKDEVKIQHQGLFPYFSKHLFNIAQFAELKVTMEDLLTVIPELVPLMSKTKGSTLTAVGNVEYTQIILSESLCDGYNATWQTILRRIVPTLPAIQQTFETPKTLEIHFVEPIGFLSVPGFFVADDGTIYTASTKSSTSTMSEIMVHYLLLYNLSMLSRYETEWWGDLFSLKEDIDFQAINIYLDASAGKFPFLAASWLQQIENGKNPDVKQRRD